MKKLNFKIWASCLIGFQISFSLLSQPLINKQNIYPFFDWKIFHRYPWRQESKTAVYIHSINSKKLEPAQQLLKLKKYFPHLDVYSFGGKYFKEEHFAPQSQSFLEIEKLLLGDLLYLKWEVRNITFDVLDFYKYGAVTKTTSVGIYESKN